MAMTPSIPQPDYTAHPMLDPGYLERDPVGARSMVRTYLEMSRSDEAYNLHLNRNLNPRNHPRSLAENLETTRRYLVDVNAYIHEVLGLLAPSVRKSLVMDAEVAARNATRDLFDLALRGDTPRVRFEAQRKLYLAKLFFDIDHDPGVQNGREHKEYFDDLIAHELWVDASRVKPVDVYYGISADGLKMTVHTRPVESGQEKWRFHLMRLKRAGRRPIHVYHYACRFKREVAPFAYREGEAEYEVAEKAIWETLHERRSGSILSKMIRKGIVHPRKIQDIIGAMFIVKDTREVNDLQDILFDVFGGPLRWKDQVNTIARPADRARLNAQSGRGYEVLKSDVDVLYSSPRAGIKPYIFSVEVQIYTVDGFLRTVHSGHYASHQQLKLRQFLEGLLPYLFPVKIYGQKAIMRAMESLNGVQPPPVGAPVQDPGGTGTSGSPDPVSGSSVSGKPGARPRVAE